MTEVDDKFWVNTMKKIYHLKVLSMIDKYRKRYLLNIIYLFLYLHLNSNFLNISILK